MHSTWTSDASALHTYTEPLTSLEFPPPPPTSSSLLIIGVHPKNATTPPRRPATAIYWVNIIETLKVYNIISIYEFSNAASVSITARTCCQRQFTRSSSVSNLLTMGAPVASGSPTIPKLVINRQPTRPPASGSRNLGTIYFTGSGREIGARHGM